MSLSNKNQLLVKLFDECEEQFPDKSTEFLLEITAERARMRGIKNCDCGDVTEALFQESKRK